MLLLNSTTDILQVVTDATCTLDVHASYSDRASGVDTPGRKNTKITTATTTDIVVAPGSSVSRNIRYASIANIHASNSVNVIVQHTDGTVTVQKFRLQLLAGWTLVHAEGEWQLVDAAGAPILTPLTGRFIKRTTLSSASGNITTQPATKTLFIRGVGAGSGGAGCTTVASAASAGGGGGAGGYLEKTVPTTGNTALAYTCGALGAGASAAAGGNGGDSTFVVGGTTYTAKGATGAVVATALTTLSSYPGGVGGVVSINGDINSGGQPGESGHITVVATPVGASGGGGSGPFGGGGKPIAAVGNGNAAVGFGAGGGGAMTGASAVRTGGDGTAGCWVVDEYA